MMRLREGLFFVLGWTLPLAAPLMAQEEASSDIKNKAIPPLAGSEGQQATIPDLLIRRRPSSLLSFSLAKVQNLGENDHYQRLYGTPNKMGFIQTGYYVYSNQVDIGFSAKFGYYNASGHPLTSLSGLSVPVKGDLPDSVQVDKKQSITMTLIPVQALFEAAYSPFPVSRRITFRGWIGPEFTFVQETLKPNLPTTTTAPAGTSLVSKGWNQGIVTGGMVSISITGVESRSDYALKSIGVDRTYISPFVEYMKTTNDKMGNLDRKIYGISITFEGLR
ncbi:MAG: hypothetical protein H7249_11870 [Chitinophagaceae bacterium]|nr:hypothetical protein [Oligoflexus sp.]